MGTLDRICGSEKEKQRVLDFVDVFNRDTKGLPDYERICNQLLSEDIEENMKAIEYVIGDVLFGHLILGCDILSSNPNRMDYDSFETSYADYEVTLPSATEEDISEFAIALYAWITLDDN